MTFFFCFLAFVGYLAYRNDNETRIKLAREATRLAELQVIAAGFSLPAPAQEDRA